MAQIVVDLPSDGETASVTELSQQITTIVDEFNGNIDDDNVKASAAIDGSKIADDSITNAKLLSSTSNEYANRPIFSAFNASGSASNGIKTYDTVNVDTASGYSAGVYTCPKDGLYYVHYTGFSDNSTSAGALYIRKNSSNFCRAYSSNNGSYYYSVSVQTVLDCVTSDTIDIYSAFNLHNNDEGQLTIIYMGTA